MTKVEFLVLFDVFLPQAPFRFRGRSSEADEMTTEEWVWRTTFMTAALGACLEIVGTAKAGELRIPQSHPLVAVDIPDNWSIERSTFAVVMQSPEKDSIVIASVVSGDKATVDGWNREAEKKLKAFGVHFDTKPQDPKKPQGTPTPEATRVNPDTFLPNSAELDFDHAFAVGSGTSPLPSAPLSTKPEAEATNAPSITIPATPAPASTPAPHLPATPAKQKVPFRSVQINGASLNGKKVDVQLLIYFISQKQRFLMLQESGPSDDRAVEMAQSVRPIKATP